MVKYWLRKLDSEVPSKQRRSLSLHRVSFRSSTSYTVLQVFTSLETCFAEVQPGPPQARFKSLLGDGCSTGMRDAATDLQ